MSSTISLASAYDRRLPELRALRDRQLSAVNVDLASAVTKVLGTLPGLQTLRETIRALPGIDQDLVDGLEEYALAAAEASSLHARAVANHGDLTELAGRARRVRDTLRMDAAVLARRGLIPPGCLVRCTRGRDYRSVVREVVDWATLLLGCWSNIEGRTGLSRNELLAAKHLAESLLVAMAARHRQRAVVEDTRAVRDAAFTMLVRSYDEVRRAVMFLTHREAAERVVPSLYRRKRRRDGVERVLLAESVG